MSSPKRIDLYQIPHLKSEIATTDQFFQDGSNKRTDAYGGSIENRARFLLEVAYAMTSVWGVDRFAVRIAPGGTWNHMRDSNPALVFTYVAEQLNLLGLAYLHIIEPRVKGNVTIHKEHCPIASEQLREVFKGKIVAAGGFEPKTAETAIESRVADAVAFGRHFVANPDLPLRIREGLALTPYDRDTFYTFDSVGYNDYPFVNEVAAREAPEEHPDGSFAFL
jgi:N-ethylmaleimide reductase